MMDLLELGAAVVIGVGASRVVQHLFRRKPNDEAKPNVPTCGCGHPRSMHAEGKGKCFDMKKMPATQSKGSHHIKCPCQFYEGPEPLPEYYAPELGG